MGKVTNKFFDYIQPTIVKTSNDEELPEHLRNRYFINMNVLGIRYFLENYLLQENDEGIPYLIYKEDKGAILLEDSPEDYDKILDIPRIYIDITEKFIKNSDIFMSFWYQASMQNYIYSVGIDEFFAGKDYWINATLYDYLAKTNQARSLRYSIMLPNYLTENDNVHITKYWEDLNGSWQGDYTNLDYFEKKNRQRDNKYTEDQLKDFSSSFCQEILDNTIIDDETRLSGNNPLYDLVLHYFANHQSDCASTAMNLVLNGLFSYSSSNSCACNSAVTSQNLSNITTQSCSSLYEQGMLNYLKQMLGDINFYNDWLGINLSEYDWRVNDLLVENLIQLLEEFIDMDFNLTFSQQTNVHSSFNCNVTATTAESTNNTNALNNYIKLLNLVLSGNLVANTNKIKIWGEAFGELLPSLQF